MKNLLEDCQESQDPDAGDVIYSEIEEEIRLREIRLSNLQNK